MAANPQDFQDKLKAIRKGFAKALPGKLAEINAQIAVCQANPDDRDALNTLHRYTHSLAGSGATFGYKQTSQYARKVDDYLKELLADQTYFSEEVAKKVCALCSELENTAKSEMVRVSERGIKIQSRASNVETVTQTGANVLDASRLIYLVEDEEFAAGQLKIQLTQFNYHIEVYRTLQEFEHAMTNILPAVVIMDIELPDGNGAEFIKKLYDEKNISAPTIFLSSHSDTLNRLKAVRCGGVAYFDKPVEVGLLVDRLDQITVTIPEEAYRILVVENSKSVAEFISATLVSVGMETKVVIDPMEVLAVLRDFTPDLILMSLYMSGCTGLEMSKVIRQQESFLSIPIVYLSGETDLDMQLSAIGAGGDEFLTKPIKPNHLISAVQSRAKRARSLRSLMMRDSLTGLLNHTSLKDKLEVEMSRSRRLGNGLVFGMLDIDHFKSVNDTYGHGIGDRVIKSLSRMLQQRLRRSDIIGRYGGEEFAVVLLDTGIEDAVRIMNDIRESFASLEQETGERRFNVSFSSGLAAFPDFTDVAELCNAADEALYESKGNGRNRVTVKKN